MMKGSLSLESLGLQAPARTLSLLLLIVAAVPEGPEVPWAFCLSQPYRRPRGQFRHSPEQTQSIQNNPEQPRTTQSIQSPLLSQLWRTRKTQNNPVNPVNPVNPEQTQIQSPLLSQLWRTRTNPDSPDSSDRPSRKCIAFKPRIPRTPRKEKQAQNTQPEGPPSNRMPREEKQTQNIQIAQQEMHCLQAQ